MKSSIDFQSFVEEVKQRNPIEDVIEESGPEYGLNRRAGRELEGVTHNSLKVNPKDGLYVWFSQGREGGDVFSWLHNRNGMQFMEALEYLARRAHLEMPKWNEGQDLQALEARGREDVWTLAQPILANWLRADAEAMAYLMRGPTASGKPRFFSAETIEAAGIGFTGRDPQARKAEMARAFMDAGIDPDCPAAVAVIGYEGDVSAYAQRWNVEPNDNWVQQGWISGLLGARRIVYPHMRRGRTVYFSARNILGSEVNRDGSERKSYNLASALSGPHQLYQNWVFHPRVPEVTIVEGPGDAIALGQMGMPAVALLGAHLDDHEEQLNSLCRYHDTVTGGFVMRRVYLGIDADAAGWKSLIGKDDWPAARIFGPMARVVNWQADEQHRKFETVLPDGSAAAHHKKLSVKDANDYLVAFEQAGGGASPMGEPASSENGPSETAQISQDSGARLREHVLGEAQPLVMGVARWAAAKKGAERDAAVKGALGVIAQLQEFDRAQLRTKLAKLLDVSVRELDALVKSVAAATEKVRAMGEPVYTWGGQYNGWMVEYLYDINEDHAMLAWRDPDGLVGSGESVNIDGVLLMPFPPNDSLRSGAILFPSELGERKSIRELVVYIRMYLQTIYLLPSEKMASLVAYWILTTWIYDCFETVIYLRAMGGAGSGKSELMKRIGLICYRTMTANGAGSTSSLFRTLERYKGTVFIDEADIANSDTEGDMIKFYNLGAMRGNPIWRTVEVTGPNGEKDFDTVGFQTFCPKLVAMRKEFRDDAVGSRSLTLKLVAREMTELLAAGIPLTINNGIREKAQALRNMLLRWRLETWEKEILVDFSFYDLSISARLNQVAGPLLAIARDEPEQQTEIRTTLREYYAETILNQSMTLAARVVEALWKIWQYPDLQRDMVKRETDGQAIIKIGDVTRIANEIMNAMNDEDEKDDDKNSNRNLKPQRIGRILRDELQMQITPRRRDGFWVYWNEPRLQGLSTKFGIDPADFGPKNGDANLKKPAVSQAATQGNLVNL
jgi:DNA primase